jgi:hypothetical protein
MGPLDKYYWLLATLCGGSVILVVAVLVTPESYVLIPTSLLVLWFGMLTLKLSDIRCRCGWRLDLSMSWLRGWPKPECPACGRDLRQP